MQAEKKITTWPTIGRNDTDRRQREDVSNLRYEVVGGKVVSIVTGRPVHVFSPPDRPTPRPSAEDEIDVALTGKKSAELRTDVTRSLEAIDYQLGRLSLDTEIRAGLLAGREIISRGVELVQVGREPVLV